MQSLTWSRRSEGLPEGAVGTAGPVLGWACCWGSLDTVS